jgi:uncharacterized membrane protein YccC
LNKLLTSLGDWRETKPRLRQALKAAIAACLSYLIADLLGLPQAFWTAVVAIVVTQASIGASLGQALDWFLGSVIGGVVGGAVAILVGSTSQAHMLAGLAGTIFVLGFFAATRPQMRIACVNATIIILTNSGATTPVASAGMRILEVVIGTAVAILIMLVILPARAGPVLANHIAHTLPLYFSMLDELLGAALSGQYDTEGIAKTNAKIRTAVATNEALSRQVQTEVAGFLADNPDPEALLTALRRLWHTELMLARTVSVPLPAEALSRLRPGLEELRQAIEELRYQVSPLHAARGGSAKAIAKVEQSVARLSEEIADIHDSGALRSMPMDDVLRLMTFDFALEQLRQNVKDLAKRSYDFTRFVGVPVPWTWPRRLRLFSKKA